MSTYHLDFVNGNNANDGSTWALAKKSFIGYTDGLAAGDELHVAKSPDPVSLGDATFTNNSDVITLATAKTITVSDCDTNWTQSTNVTTSLDSGYLIKHGTYSLKFVVGTSFTTGKAAYLNLGGSLNLSSYQKLTFWFYSQTAIASGKLQIKLCSDTAGNTAVDTFTVNTTLASYRYYSLTIDKGSALGNDINSIAIYFVTDPGAVTFWVNSFLACNDLHYNSAIGKNDKMWYPIKTINGTTVSLGYESDIGTYNKKYYGVGETVTCYALNTNIWLGYCSSTDTEYDNLSFSGESGNPIKILGGYNTTSNTRDGETWIGGLNEAYGVINMYATYVEMDRICAMKLRNLVAFAEEGYINECVFTNICGASISTLFNMWYAKDMTISDIYTASGYGLFLNGYSRNITIENVYQYNEDLYLACDELYLNNINVRKGSIRIFSEDFNASDLDVSYGTYGIEFASSNGHVKDSTISGTTSDVFYALSSRVTFDNVLFNGGVKEFDVQAYSDYMVQPINNSYLSSKKHDQVAGKSKTFTQYGTIESEDTIRHTASGISWKLTPNDTDHVLRILPGNFKSVVLANQEVTVSAYVRKNATYSGSQPQLCLIGGIIEGIDTNVIDTMSVAEDVWELLSVQATPTEAGTIEFYINCDGTAGNIYVDDITVSQ